MISYSNAVNYCHKTIKKGKNEVAISAKVEMATIMIQSFCCFLDKIIKTQITQMNY